MPQGTARPNRTDLRPIASLEAGQTVTVQGAGVELNGRHLMDGRTVVAALNDPAGREFLDHFHPGELLAHNREEGNDPGLPRLEQLLGLGLADLDHVVLGLTLEGRELPRVMLVARIRHSLDANKGKVIDALKARPEPGVPGKKDLYHFKLDKALFDTFLWFADQHTLVVSLSARDLDALPSGPAEGMARLTPALRDLIKTRLNNAAPQAWAAGHVEDWDKTMGSQIVLGFLSKDNRQTLEKVREFGAWLRFDKGLAVGADFHCADATAAEALERQLVPAGPRKPLRILGGRPETTAVAEELAQSLKSTRKEDWVTLQATARAETVRQALKPAR